MSTSALTASATNLSQAQLHDKVATAVARKSLDAARQQGQNALALLESAARLQDSPLGGGAQPGKGAHLDVRG